MNSLCPAGHCWRLSIHTFLRDKESFSYYIDILLESETSSEEHLTVSVIGADVVGYGFGYGYAMVGLGQNLTRILLYGDTQ